MTSFLPVDMLPSLDNFIDFGKDVFANRPDYRNMIIDFYTTALTSTSLSGDQDRVNGCKLGEAILLHLRGQVDDVRYSHHSSVPLPLTYATLVSRLYHQ